MATTKPARRVPGGLPDDVKRRLKTTFGVEAEQLRTKWQVQAAVLADADLSTMGALLMHTLLTRADKDTSEIPQKHSPSLSDLARMSKMDRSTVNKTLKVLVDGGWLTRWIPETAEARRGARARYLLLVPASADTPEVVAQDNHPSGSGQPGVVAEDDQAGSQEPPAVVATGHQGGGLEPLKRSSSGSSGSSREEERPPPRCPQHTNDDDPPACGACGTARRAAEAWDANQKRAAAERVSAEARQRHTDRARAISTCNLCDEHGYVGRQICHHDPTAPAIAARGSARVRAVLAGI